MIRRRKPVLFSGVNGVIKFVKDGANSTGIVAQHGDLWRAIGRGGRHIGYFTTAAQAQRAVHVHFLTPANNGADRAEIVPDEAFVQRLDQRLHASPPGGRS